MIFIEKTQFVLNGNSVECENLIYSRNIGERLLFQLDAYRSMLNSFSWRGNETRLSNATMNREKVAETLQFSLINIETVFYT